MANPLRVKRPFLEYSVSSSHIFTSDPHNIRPLRANQLLRTTKWRTRTLAEHAQCPRILSFYDRGSHLPPQQCENIPLRSPSGHVLSLKTARRAQTPGPRPRSQRKLLNPNYARRSQRGVSTARSVAPSPTCRTCEDTPRRHPAANRHARVRFPRSTSNDRPSDTYPRYASGARPRISAHPAQNLSEPPQTCTHQTRQPMTAPRCIVPRRMSGRAC